jgi:hypothetical protein
VIWQVLSIGETVEEVNDSGFEGKVATIRCQLMADDSMLQVRRQSMAGCCIRERHNAQQPGM